MNDVSTHRSAEHRRVVFEFNPASFELVAQKRNLDQESCKQRSTFDYGGLVLVHRRTFLIQAHFGRVSTWIVLRGVSIALLPKPVKR